ncbi:hypothetical protein DO71_6082 [Burkholderia pseudomallei]|nr:hypothetical protein DO71_6082 [Burkholderia pseudomallei]
MRDTRIGDARASPRATPRRLSLPPGCASPSERNLQATRGECLQHRRRCRAVPTRGSPGAPGGRRPARQPRAAALRGRRAVSGCLEVDGRSG